ncbi:MAG: Glucosamine-fructose-6-phosphate aminotransferase, partial [Myxococcaceae bacterium]|nr:Glucosamine-fructose-6-phosphate aminotransferase [Myxococcaceae bacterium]
RGDVITAARGTEARETLGRLLDPGFYYVYVRDGGQGNRANFELRARTNVIGAP